MRVRMRGCNESPKQGVRLVRLAVEFRVELAGDKEGMLGQFNDLDQLAVGRKSAKDEIRFLEALFIGVVKFISMPVPFIHNKGPIKPCCLCPDDQLTGLRPESHGAALL